MCECSGAYLTYILLIWFCDYMIWWGSSFYFSPTNRSLEIIKTNHWVLCLSLFLADLLGILFHYAFEREEDEKKKDKDELPEKEKVMQSLYLVLISSLLSFLSISSDFFYLIILKYESDKLGDNSILIVDFSLRFILCKVIELKKTTSFDYLSMGLIAIGSICTFAILILKGNFTNETLFSRIILYLKIVIKPIEDIINNYLLKIKKIKNSSIMLTRGFYNVSLITIITLFLILFGSLDMTSLFHYEYLLDIFSLIGFILINLFFGSIKNYNILTVIKNFSVINAHFCYTSLFLRQYLERRKKENSTFNTEDLANIFFFIIIVFIILVYGNLIPSKYFISEAEKKENKVDEISNEINEIESVMDDEETSN